MSRNRVYLVLAGVAGIAALILGLVLANGQRGPQPVIAVQSVSGASPKQVEAMVASSKAHRADMVLLYTSTWQRAAADMKALSGYHSPVDVSVMVTSAGQEAIASGLPADAQVIDADGKLLRAGATPGGPGLLVALWACLLLLFAYLVSRVVVRLREAGARPEPSPQDAAPIAAIAPAAPAAPTQRDRTTFAREILARYLPPDAVARWEPQCPRCGASPAAAAAGNGYECLSCLYRWPVADAAQWPDVVLSHRRRHEGERLRPSET